MSMTLRIFNSDYTGLVEGIIDEIISTYSKQPVGKDEFETVVKAGRVDGMQIMKHILLNKLKAYDQRKSGFPDAGQGHSEG